MSSIFISHSSQDGEWSAEVRRQLELQGHRSVFLDFDPAIGIPAGRDWEQELYQQLRACRAVLVLCSRHSMASRWCFAEITHAKSMGKALLPLKIDDCEIDPVLTSRQVIDLTRDPEAGWERLRRGLVVAGLDPADAFDWQGDRPPYPGLLSFQEEDAAVYFGRNNEIQAGLEALQRLHQFGGSRWLMVLGASGSGKSSLVRAGLLPRLRRDRQRWLVLDPFRPGQDPFWELTRVLTRGLGPRSHGEQIYQRLQGATFEPPEPVDGPESVDLHEPLSNLEQALGRLGNVEARRYFELLRKAVDQKTEGAAPVPGSSPSVIEPPLVELARVLIERSEQREARVLLVIDQFEELLGDESDSVSSRFLELLRGAADHPAAPLQILVTLRSDFFAQFQTTATLLELRPGTLSVGPLSAAGIAQTIVEPARLAGLELETGLVETLVQDSQEADSLPLLAFALRELWERCDGGRLTVDEYQTRLGGLSGAVAHVADTVLANTEVLVNPAMTSTILSRMTLDKADAERQRERGRQLRGAFLALSRIDEDGRFARRPARWSDLPADLHPVLERFVQARLLVSRGEGEHRVLEVAHEALFHSWDQLRNWLDEDREFLLWRKRLQAARQQWLDTEQDDGALLRGIALADAENWLGERPRELAVERPFIEQSAALRDHELALASRRRRRVLQGVTLAALICLALAAVAWHESVKAKQLSNERRAALVVEASRNLRDPATRALLLLESAAILPGREPAGGARAARSVAGWAIPRSVLHGHTGSIVGLDFSPDGDRVATSSYDNTVRVFSSDGTGQPLVLRGHSGDVVSVEFDAAGKRLASASADGTVRIWSLDGDVDPIVLQVFDKTASDEAVSSARFSPDGQRLVAATMAGTVVLYILEGNHPSRVLEGHTGPVLQARFSPDGEWILSASRDGTARLWSTGDGASRIVARHEDWVLDGVWSADGSRLATTSRDRRVWVCAPQRASPCQQLTGHDGWVWTAAFDTEGTHLVTAGADNTARVWPLDGKGEPSVLWGHEDWVREVSFSADGRRVLTASHDGSAALWLADGSGEPTFLEGHQGWVRKAIFSPGGGLIATASDDGLARVWRSTPPEDPRILSGHTDQVWSVAFSHLGQSIVTASADLTARIWDAESLESLRILKGHEERVRSAEFSPDDRWLATSSDDGTARIWSVDGSGAPVILRGHRDKVLDVDFSHDGKLLATASYDQTIGLWQPDGTRVRTFDEHLGWVRAVAFSPDDSQILSASRDRTVLLRNTDGSGASRVVGRHKNQVMAAIFKRDGTKILSASADRTARLWDAVGEDGELGRFVGHESLVWGADLSPDGSWVVTASQDGTARVWRADDPSAEPIFLDGHNGPIWNATFSRDGKVIATASADETVRLWRLWSKDWSQLIELLRHQTNACLTVAQRQRFLAEPVAQASERYAACETRNGRTVN